jgi:hypothetical protein
MDAGPGQTARMNWTTVKHTVMAEFQPALTEALPLDLLIVRQNFS